MARVVVGHEGQRRLQYEDVSSRMLVGSRVIVAVLPMQTDLRPPHNGLSDLFTRSRRIENARQAAW
jgi:hypothetical protein